MYLSILYTDICEARGRVNRMRSRGMRRQKKNKEAGVINARETWMADEWVADKLRKFYVDFARGYRRLLLELQTAYKNLSDESLRIAANNLRAYIVNKFNRDVIAHMAQFNKRVAGEIVTALKDRAIMSLNTITNEGIMMGKDKLEMHIDNIASSILTVVMTELYEMILNSGVEVELQNVELT